MKDIRKVPITIIMLLNRACYRHPVLVIYLVRVMACVMDSDIPYVPRLLLVTTAALRIVSTIALSMDGVVSSIPSVDVCAIR